MSGPHPGDISLAVEDDPAPEDVEAVAAGLRAYNARFVDPGPDGANRPLAVFARDGVKVLGGANGYTAWGWLHLRHLWVDDAVRGTGLGSELLGRFEAAGMARGATAAWVDTYSFQARPFYEKLGYRQFGELADHPRGHRHHFLWKPLGPGGTRS